MRKRQKDRDLTRVAYHEAGHAVANFFFGRSVKSITIKATEKSGGKTILHRAKPADIRTTRRPRYYVEREIICYFAGSAAEEHYFPDMDCAEKFTSFNDFKMACGLAEQFCPRPPEAEAYWKWLYERTVTFISSEPYWSAVSSIANALMTHKTVSGRAARQIYNECCSRQRPES